jgi:hypothetical protein
MTTSLTSIVTRLTLISTLVALSACSGTGFLLGGSRYLYVSSGACYGGGVITSTGLGVISRYDPKTGVRTGPGIQYYSQSLNDQPAGIINYNPDYLMVLVENAAGRRIDLASKYNNGQINVFSQNATILATQLRGLSASADGSFFVSRATAIEKVAANKQRITSSGIIPYINAPAAPCATSTTNMTATVELPGGKLFYTHGAATPNNRVGLISAAGYIAAPNCLASQALPITTALPTAAIRHSSGFVLVAYGSTISGSNGIYAYTVDENANTISAPIVAYSNPSVINGPSAMVEDPTTGIVYVANSTSGSESIEAFTVDSNTGVMTRTTNQSLVSTEPYVRCVSGLVVSN